VQTVQGRTKTTVQGRTKTRAMPAKSRKRENGWRRRLRGAEEHWNIGGRWFVVSTLRVMHLLSKLQRRHGSRSSRSWRDKDAIFSEHMRSCRALKERINSRYREVASLPVALVVDDALTSLAQRKRSRVLGRRCLLDRAAKLAH
jgi:hypothetical protein